MGFGGRLKHTAKEYAFGSVRSNVVVTDARQVSIGAAGAMLGTRFVASAAAVVVAGMQLSGMSRIVVIPPAAAARVALSNPSHAVRPG